MTSNGVRLVKRGKVLLLLILFTAGASVNLAANPLDAVVRVHATVPGDARTADTLGTSREGSGVVIGDDGLTLTIGYLIMESTAVELSLPNGRNVPAEVVAYDYDSGFGLLRPLVSIEALPVAFGDSAKLEERSPVLVVSYGGREAATAAYVVSRREFTGYWEYLLPDAIFTTPPHGQFGGAALFDRHGALLGIGSLIVGDAAGAETPLPGNMFVPIDALKPILDDLIAHGRATTPTRPWLGVYTNEIQGRLFVSRVAPGGPAAEAGIAEGDLIVAVAGRSVSGQADFYRKLWALGNAGVQVPLTLRSSAGSTEVTVTSGDRYDYLKLDRSY